MRVHVGAIWRIRSNCPRAATVRPCVNNCIMNIWICILYIVCCVSKCFCVFFECTCLYFVTWFGRRIAKVSNKLLLLHIIWSFVRISRVPFYRPLLAFREVNKFGRIRPFVSTLDFISMFRCLYGSWSCLSLGIFVQLNSVVVDQGQGQSQGLG